MQKRLNLYFTAKKSVAINSSLSLINMAANRKAISSIGGVMPKLTINGRTADAHEGKRLVLAIEETGIHIGHRCGGNARCTTCRVKFIKGEPQQMTRAEYQKLTERELFGKFRLSCQIVCRHDMEVQPQMTLESEGWSDTGPTPLPIVAPEAKWFSVEQLQKERDL